GGGGFHLTQQVLDILDPDLAMLLMEEGELAQMVDTRAPRMTAGGAGPVGSPAITDSDAAVAGQDANGVGRSGAALGMEGLVHKAMVRATCAQARWPAWRTPVSQHVQHRRLAKRWLDPRLEQCHDRRGLLRPGDERAARKGSPPEQIVVQLAHAA